MKSRAEPRPDCPRCQHYYVTYEPGFPHGCHFFRMRSRGLPAAEVERSSGKPCQAFVRRPSPQPPGRSPSTKRPPDEKRGTWA